MVSSNRIADTARQLPAALRRTEQQAAHDAAAPLARALADAQRTATRQWLHATDRQALPSPTALDRLITAIKQALTDAFRGKGKLAADTIRIAAFHAAQLSARQAAALAAAMSGTPTPPVQPTIGPEAATAADVVPAAVENEHHRALALLTAASVTALGFAGVTGVFNRARRAVTRIARHAAVAVTSAAAHAATAVARAIGPTIRLLWVAEPGACPACGAYAGRSVVAGRRFPAALSLDPQRTVFATAPLGPPLHPSCRCWTIPYSPTWPVDGTPLPALLRRAARTERRA
ncbi:hypothetical protein ACZ90_70720 [Streptomyces albus subsp. albus]|uniref:hypothetical protein n=1 Tax=Streptomyces TaxID=1883 RepID=UPI0004BD2868|nr:MULTISPECIES: hypothetical protein [Streptomyces]KOG78701.1 hypothetical protein ADK33_25625 [Streptomyces griseus subsp. rhodochrous]KUJ35969.1 hypothetical protein ACZ90_70720 [Streptomyces albus subsp. albus]